MDIIIDKTTTEVEEEEVSIGIITITTIITIITTIINLKVGLHLIIKDQYLLQDLKVLPERKICIKIKVE